MRQSEFKKKYDPELGRYTKHIYGEGVMDIFKSYLERQNLIWKDNEKSRQDSGN